MKELSNDKVSELSFTDCDGSMTWANDSLTLFFGELDDTHRPTNSGAIAWMARPPKKCSMSQTGVFPALLPFQLGKAVDPVPGQQDHQ